MEKLERVVNNPEQRAAEMWQQASDIMVKHKGQLQRRTSRDGEDTYLVTPAFVPAKSFSLKGEYDTKWNKMARNTIIQGADPEPALVFGQSYAVAALVDRRHNHYRPGDSLYLIINDNLTNPQVKINAYGGGLQLLDERFNDIEDNGRYVPRILDVIDKRLTAIEMQKSDSRLKKVVVVGAVATVLSLVGGGLFGWRYKNEQDLAADNRARATFDAKGINLRGTPLSAGNISFMLSDPSFFTPDMPQPADNDDFEHPRKVTLGNEGCKHLTNLNVDNQAVLAVTDGPNERVLTAVSSAGDVEACYFGDVPKDKFPNVILQIVSKTGN